MSPICRDHDFGATPREPMGGPPMPRRAHDPISTNRGGTKRYYHYDALGTVWALSTGSGLVSDQYNYTAFGVLLSSSGSSVNPYRFVGQWGYYDDGARGSGYGLSLLGVRYYSAAFGRFWSWDPATDPSDYSYANAKPTLYIDPSGTFILGLVLLHHGVYPWPPGGSCREGESVERVQVNQWGPVVRTGSCGSITMGISSGLTFTVTCDCSYTLRSGWWIACDWHCKGGRWVQTGCVRCAGYIEVQTFRCPPGSEYLNSTKISYVVNKWPCANA